MKEKEKCKKSDRQHKKQSTLKYLIPFNAIKLLNGRNIGKIKVYYS